MEFSSRRDFRGFDFPRLCQNPDLPNLPTTDQGPTTTLATSRLHSIPRRPLSVSSRPSLAYSKRLLDSTHSTLQSPPNVAHGLRSHVQTTIRFIHKNMIPILFYLIWWSCLSFVSCSKSTVEPNADVIVIGAGWAGMAAASHIAANAPNVSLLVLESTNRTGGRTEAIAMGGGGDQKNPSSWKTEPTGFRESQSQGMIPTFALMRGKSIAPMYLQTS